MITLRRAGERHHDRRRKRDAWLTFNPADGADPFAGGFGTLEVLDEDRLSPGAGLPSPARRDAEVITYVREGTLAYDDSLGRSGVIQAGEFQRMTVGRGIRHGETNASRNAGAHIFRLWLRTNRTDLEPGHDEKRFSAAQRRGGLCVVASPDGRRGSLLIYQDALVYSALLDPGQHIVHELSLGRCSWLHLVEGEVTFGDEVLSTGDGVGVTAERAVSFTARQHTEILLIDLGDHE